MALRPSLALVRSRVTPAAQDVQPVVHGVHVGVAPIVHDDVLGRNDVRPWEKLTGDIVERPFLHHVNRVAGLEKGVA